MSGNSWVGKHKKELLGAGLLGAGALAIPGVGGGLLSALGLGSEAAAGAAAPLSAADAYAVASGGQAATGGLLGGFGNALEGAGKVAKFGQLAGMGEQPQQLPPPQMPQAAPQVMQSTVPTMEQTLGQPFVDPETLRRRQRMMAGYGGGYG